MKVNGNGLVEIYGEKDPRTRFFLHEVVSLPKYRSRTGNGSLCGTFGNNDLTKPS